MVILINVKILGENKKLRLLKVLAFYLLGANSSLFKTIILALRFFMRVSNHSKLEFMNTFL